MADSIIPPKQCSKCKASHPPTLEYFAADNRASDKLQSQCRECQREKSRTYRRDNYEVVTEKQRIYRETNRDLIRERERGYYANNPEPARERSRHWRRDNPERFREQKRQWVKENPDRARELQRQYYHRTIAHQRQRSRKYRLTHIAQTSERTKRWAKANPDKRRVSELKRRSLQAKAPYTFTLAHERLALEYFNGCCAVCGRQLRDLFGTHTVHWDHWIPLSKGGGTTPDNMLPLCGGQGGCNQSKGSKPPADWLLEHYTPHQTKLILKRIEAYFVWIKAQSITGEE